MGYIDNLKYLRKVWKYSQKDMANLLETTQQQYSKYENSQQELPIRHLITICEHFSVSADWLLELREDVQRKERITESIILKLPELKEENIPLAGAVSPEYTKDRTMPSFGIKVKKKEE